MTEIEKSYIAGIIDGEGSIMLQKFHNNQFPAPYVSIASTTLELLKSVYPYLVIYSKKKRANLIITRYKDVTPRNGRYSEDLLKKKNDFYKEFMSIK